MNPKTLDGGVRLEYLNKGDFERRKEGDLGVEERYGVGNLEGVGTVGRGDEAAEEDGVDGGGLVLEGVEDELDVSVLGDLVFQLAAHDSVIFATHHCAAGFPTTK